MILILVVVDDGLVHQCIRVLLYLLADLILIVVEDSLVPYVCIPLDVNEMS